MLASLICNGLTRWAVARIGLVAGATCLLTSGLLNLLPLTSDLSAPYAHVAILALGTVAALAALGFVTSHGGRRPEPAPSTA